MVAHPPDGWQDSYYPRVSKPAPKPAPILNEVRNELRAMACDAIRARSSMMVNPHRVLEVLDALDALDGAK